MNFCFRIGQQRFRRCLFMLCDIDSPLRVQDRLVGLDHAKHNSLVGLFAHRARTGGAKPGAMNLFLGAEPVKQHPWPLKRVAKLPTGVGLFKLFSAKSAEVNCCCRSLVPKTYTGSFAS